MTTSYKLKSSSVIPSQGELFWGRGEPGIFTPPLLTSPTFLWYLARKKEANVSNFPVWPGCPSPDPPAKENKDVFVIFSFCAQSYFWIPGFSSKTGYTRERKQNATKEIRALPGPDMSPSTYQFILQR